MTDAERIFMEEGSVQMSRPSDGPFMPCPAKRPVMRLKNVQLSESTRRMFSDAAAQEQAFVKAAARAARSGKPLSIRVVTSFEKPVSPWEKKR